jgi:hypothetical protein
MEIKTFCGTDIDRIEQEINGFLAELDKSEISYIAQSQGESSYGHMYTISIFFTRKKSTKKMKEPVTKKKTTKGKKIA